MIVSESALRTFIRKSILKEQMMADNPFDSGGGPSGGGPPETPAEMKARCCSKWKNKTKEWRDTKAKAKTAENIGQRDYWQQEANNLKKNIPKAYSPHGPSGDWLVDKCGNTRGQPVYGYRNGIKTFMYSCTRSPGGADVSDILSNVVVQSFEPGSDLNRILNFIDVTRLTQIPGVVDAGEDFLLDPGPVNAGIFLLSALDIIPGGNLAKNATEEGVGEAAEIIASEYREELNDMGFSDDQIDLVLSSIEAGVGRKA